MTESAAAADVIDKILGIEAGDRLDGVRRTRPTAREQAQVAYDAIFAPAHPGALSVAERYAVAYAVAAWTGVPVATDHYRAALTEHESRPEILAALDRVIADGAGPGPFGQFREPGLAGQGSDGNRLEVAATEVEVLGGELAALLAHAHALVLRPRESSPELLERVVAAGWEATEIVALAQLVSYLSFQTRLVAGLQVLRGTWNGTAA